MEVVELAKLERRESSHFEMDEEMLNSSLNKIFLAKKQNGDGNNRRCEPCCFCFHNSRSSVMCFKSVIHISMIFAIIATLYVAVITLGLINYKRMTTLFLRETMTDSCFNESFRLTELCDGTLKSSIAEKDLYACKIAENITECNINLKRCLNDYQDSCRFQRSTSATRLRRTGQCLYEALKINSVLKRDDESAFSGEFWEEFCGDEHKVLKGYLEERRSNFTLRLLILLTSIGVFCTSIFCAVANALLRALILKFPFSKSRKKSSVVPSYEMRQPLENKAKVESTVYIIPQRLREKSAVGNSNRIFKLGQNTYV